MITLDTEWLTPTFINIAVIVLYVVFMIRGAKRGVLVQVLSSLGTVISFLAAWRYCSFAAEYYELLPKDIVPMVDIPGIGEALYSHLNEMVWFIALFAVLRLLFVILEKLCSGLSGLPVIKEVSGLFGGLLGLVSATVWVLVIYVFLNTPFFRNGAEIADSSLVGTITGTVSQSVREFAGPIDTSETIGNLYQQISDFDDTDKEVISQWLEDHGISPAGAEAPEEPSGEPAQENPDDPEAALQEQPAEESGTQE